MAPAAVSSSSADPNAPTQKKKKTTTTTTTTTNKDGSSSNNNGGVDVLAPHEAGAMEITQSISATSDITTNSSNRHTPKGKDEMTLAERVASEEMGIGGGDNNNNNNEDGAISGSIRANSMHSVLMQAVRTNDQALLDTALYSRSASEQSLAVLSTTVRNLPPQYVVPLLALLVDKFQSAPAHGLVLVQWVKVILTEHLSYLMTIPNIVASLSGLYLMIHSRLETHKTLLKLSGRLDLVLAQVAKAQMGSDAAPPLNIIAEEDDDDDDGNADPKILSVDDDNDDAEDDSDEDMEQITGEAAGYSGDNGNDVDDEEEEEEEVDDENEDDDMDEE